MTDDENTGARATVSWALGLLQQARGQTLTCLTSTEAKEIAAMLTRIDGELAQSRENEGNAWSLYTQFEREVATLRSLAAPPSDGLVRKITAALDDPVQDGNVLRLLLESARDRIEWHQRIDVVARGRIAALEQQLAALESRAKSAECELEALRSRVPEAYL